MDSPHPLPEQTEPMVEEKDPGGLVVEEVETKEKARAPVAPSHGTGKRSRLAQVGLLALVLLALVGLSTWWFFSLQGDSAGGSANSPTPPPSGLPEDAIALINSGTPIPAHYPPLTSAGNLTDPPDSQAWTPALQQAHRALEEGHYSAAASQYAALVGGGRGQEARDALWGLAETYEASGQPDQALQAYLLFTGLNDLRAAYAAIRAAHLYEKEGRNSDAITVYDHYSQEGSPIRYAMLVSKARLLSGSADAEAAYKTVINGNPPDVDLRDALTGLAELRSKKGDHAGARDLYDRLARLQSANQRPLLDPFGPPAAVLAANEAAQADDKTGARQRLTDYIKAQCPATGATKPCAYIPEDRFSALDALVKIDPTAVVSGTIDPMLAARIAFNTGRYSNAVQYLAGLRAATVQTPNRTAALLLTGRAFDSSGDAASAYNWYTATLQTYPTSPEAAEANRRAGDALEEQSLWDDSLAVYREGIERYPNASDTLVARLNAGVLAYRLGERDLALQLLGPVTTSPSAWRDLKAEATFWAGKVQKNIGNAAWRDTLKKVSAMVPGTFFDFRARSLLAGEPDGGPTIPTYAQAGISAGNLGPNYSTEQSARTDLLNWATRLPVATSTVAPTRTVAGTATTTARPTRQATTTTMPRPPRTPTQVVAATPMATTTFIPQSSIRNPHSDEVQRAMALLQANDDRAPLALRALAETLKHDGNAQELAQLVIYARYRASTRTSVQVAQTLASMDKGDPSKEPPLLLKTLYPAPYGDLVLQEAKTRDVDPLVMYALIRQESQFVPDARSSSDARGLTQVIPSTGEGIAAQLKDNSFSAEDLFLPYVSIRYGTYYLASNLPQFDRKLLPALAAYNGGPGNAARWLQGSALIDPDLYGERIDLYETEDYLQRVYTNYGFYGLIYGH